MIGDILLYSGTGFYSSAIKFFTRSKYTHVAIDVGKSKEMLLPLIFESYYSQRMGLQGHPVKRYRFDVPLEKKIEVTKNLILEYDKKDYGWGQILWFIWRWVLELFGKKKCYKMKNWFPNSAICSELGIRLIQSFIDEVNDYNVNSVSPKDIDNICKKYANEIK